MSTTEVPVALSSPPYALPPPHSQGHPTITFPLAAIDTARGLANTHSLLFPIFYSNNRTLILFSMAAGPI